MTLRLRFQNSGALPGGQESVEMVGGALTIGRGEENDLTLPDPDHTLSKRHCTIEDHGGNYVVVDFSTNGTFLNYSPERLGDLPTPLNHGDILQIGSYELVTEIASEMTATLADPLAGIAPPLEDGPVSHGQAVDNRPRHDFVGTLDDPAGKDGGDFLDGLLGPGDGAQAPAAENSRPSWERAVIPEDPLEASAPLPDQEDPFFQKPERDPFGPQGASEKDHSRATQDFYSKPKAQDQLIPDDWDDLMSPAEPAAERPMAGQPIPEAPIPDAAPSAADPFAAQSPQTMPIPGDPIAPDTQVPPGMPAEPPVGIPEETVSPPVAAAPAAPPPPVVAPTPIQAANADLVRVFLDKAGAGHLQIPDEELPEVMARMGAVYAAMVTGMREILITRASIKGELRMNRTMIQSAGNNPLKFTISPEQAIEAMVRPSTTGYLDAESATAEALRDIKAHEVAMMSGMEAALKDLLARLDPDKLTERIETGSSLGGLLGGKKAKYWEAYASMYSEIAKEAEDDFQSAFGREFARAYEEQLNKL